MTRVQRRRNVVFTSEQGRPVKVTHHAVERAVERLDMPSHGAARTALAHAWRESVAVPNRIGRELSRGRGSTRGRKERGKIRVWGSVVLVGRRNTVVTVWTITPELSAAVMVWVAMGVWVG
jgi:hypothetical protein